ncbi:MAG: polymerase subunit sigma-70 [Firmicutes bacterium]|nr:polymerase subunit sigma-70 [Bacillota bacterium]
MTPLHREEIYKLRREGLGYKAIASQLLLSTDSVKSYCKRHHLDGPAEVVERNAEVIKENQGLCLHCNNPIRQKKLGRSKKYCSDTCRYTWWNKNQDKRNINKELIRTYTCQHCGKKSSVYGKGEQKYCSHTCYIKARFWGEDNEI